MVTNWGSIKDDHVIQEMEVEEAVERFENSLIGEVSDSKEELEEEVSTLPEDEDCLITNNSQAEIMIFHPQAYALRKKIPKGDICDMNQVAHNLRRFHNNWPTSQWSLAIFFLRKNIVQIDPAADGEDEIEIV